MALTVTTTHTKTLIAPSTGVADKVYGADYVSASSHSSVVTGTLASSNIPIPFVLASPSSAAAYFEANQNSPSVMRVGVEDGSSGGSIFTGSAIGAAVFGNTQNFPVQFFQNNALKASIALTGAAGEGLAITAGTATTAVSALSVTQTWNNAAVAFIGHDYAITGAANSAAGALHSRWRMDGSDVMSISKLATLTVGNGTGALQGWIIGNLQSGYSGIWSTGISSPGGSNYVLYSNNSSTDVSLNSANGGTLTLRNNNGSRMSLGAAGTVTIEPGVAAPAAGSTSARLLFGSTSGFGIYYGSGNPTVSAAQGSIYLKSDGSGIADRLWVNTNGTTGWTNFVSAS